MSTFKDKLLSQLIDDGWKSVLKKEFSQPYFNTMCDELETEYANHEIFPPLNHVFEAFNATPYHNVKVVLIGQGKSLKFYLLTSIKQQIDFSQYSFY